MVDPVKALIPRQKGGLGHRQTPGGQPKQANPQSGNLCSIPPEIILKIVSLLFEHPIASLPPIPNPPRNLPSRLYIRLLLYRHLASLNSVFRQTSVVAFLSSIDTLNCHQLEGFVKYLDQNPALRRHVGEIKASFSRFHETKCDPPAPKQNLSINPAYHQELLPGEVENNTSNQGDQGIQNRNGGQTILTTYSYPAYTKWSPSVTQRGNHYSSFVSLLSRLFTMLSTSLRSISISQSCSISDLSYRYQRSWQGPDFSNTVILDSLTKGTYTNLRKLILVDPTPIETWGDAEGLGKFEKLEELVLILRSKALVAGFSKTHFCPPRTLMHLSIYDETADDSTAHFSPLMNRFQQLQPLPPRDTSKGLKWPLSSDFGRCDYLQSLDLSFSSAFSLIHQETKTAVGFLISTYAPTLKMLSLCGEKSLTAKERPPVGPGGGCGKTFDEAVGFWYPYNGTFTSSWMGPNPDDTPVRVLENIFERLIEDSKNKKDSLIFPSLKKLELRGSEGWKLEKILGKGKAIMPVLEKLILDRTPVFNVSTATTPTPRNIATTTRTTTTTTTEWEQNLSSISQRIWNLIGIPRLKQIWMDSEIDLNFDGSHVLWLENDSNNGMDKVLKLSKNEEMDDGNLNDDDNNNNHRRGENGLDNPNNKHLFIKALANEASLLGQGQQSVCVSVLNHRINGRDGSGSGGLRNQPTGRSVGGFDPVQWQERLGVGKWARIEIVD